MNKSASSRNHQSETPDSNDITSHDPTVSNNKSLKMKIKRKPTAQGGGGSGKSDTGSSKHDLLKPGGLGTGGATDRHDSSSNSSSASSASSSGQTGSSPGSGSNTGNAPAPRTPNPFEKLKQAILEEQEKTNKQKQAIHKPGSVTSMGKDKVKDAGQGASGLSSFARSVNNQSNVESRDSHVDPYEFNARHEDRVTQACGLGKKLKHEKQERVEMKDATTDTSHMAIMTEPDCLGPCEPGTSVVLEGIVWQETENGLLVVNVTWRGKTYVGTLLDATKHEWAPPTFRSDSPQDPDARTPRTRGGKRGRTTMNSMGGRGTRSTRNSSQPPANPPPSPAKNNSAASVGEKRKQELQTEVPPVASPAKKLKIEEDLTRGAPNVIADTWFVCSHGDCNHRYRDMAALKYHQNHAHRDTLLTQERMSEHNKTHVRFTATSASAALNSAPQQSMVAQTDDKPREKKNKKSKKSKKNKTEAMETDAPSEQIVIKSENSISLTNNSNKPLTLPNPNVIQPAKSSPPEGGGGMSMKQPRIQLTPLSVPSTGGQKTITAPIVAVPLATQAHQTAMLSEKEKKREKKKRKREKKEKKLLLEQQLQNKDGGPKVMAGQSHVTSQSGAVPGSSQHGMSMQPSQAQILNRSPPTDPNKPRVPGLHPSPPGALPAPPHPTPGVHPSPPGRSQVAIGNEKRGDEAPRQMVPNDRQPVAIDNVQSPAYSDISDEGNDNVPVLENEVELARKQQQTQVHVQPGNSRVKESNSEPVVKPVGGQEPPNLTPVITHTGHTKPPLPQQLLPGQPPLQNHVSSGMRTAPSHPSPLNSSADANRSEGPYMSREGARPSGMPNDLHAKRPPVSGAIPIYGNYPPGYQLSHSPGSTSKSAISVGSKAPMQQQAKDDAFKSRTFVSSAQSTLTAKVSPKLAGISHGIPQPQRPGMPSSDKRSPADMSRRQVDSNMNMQAKLSLPMTNGPPLPHGSKSVPSSVADINKQVASLSNHGNEPSRVSPGDPLKAPRVSPGDANKRLGEGMSMSERQTENEKILKENIELKTQMGDKDKTALLYEQQKQYAAFMQHQQRAAMQQQFQRSRPPLPLNKEVSSKPKPSGEQPSPHSSLDQSRPSPSKAPPPSSQAHHPALGAVPRSDSSPMPSPKTKAELKQGGERKDTPGKVESRSLSGDRSRPASVERPPEASRASNMKSPGPALSMSSPSAPTPGHVPPGHYPFPGYGFMYPGMSPYVFPGAPHPYMPYPLPQHADSKALEMLQQHASQYYNREQGKPQDLRKLPDNRKSPNPPDSDRPGSSSVSSDKRDSRGDSRESPAAMRRSPHMPPHPLAGHPVPPGGIPGPGGHPVAVSVPQWLLHNGSVPMMQQSPQQPSKQH